MIAAVAENGVIGNKNSLPWDLPADFNYFKEKTLGKTLILGYNTFKSIGERPLPNRKHIILSKDTIVLPADCYLAKSIEEALEIAKKLEDDATSAKASTSDKSSAGQAGEAKEIMICGGASVYQQFLPLADKLYITEIHHSFEGDTYFPEINKAEWQEVSREDHQLDEKNNYAYSFVTLTRT